MVILNLLTWYDKVCTIYYQWLAFHYAKLIQMKNLHIFSGLVVLMFGLGLIYLTRYLDQEIAKWPLQSSSQAATRYYQSNHSKVEAILLSALLKDKTCTLAGLSPQSTLTLKMLNVKQESCEYQLLKSFGLTQQGNRTIVYPEIAKWPLQSSSQAATRYYQSNHSKVEAIPLRALPKDAKVHLPAYLHSPH